MAKAQPRTTTNATSNNPKLSKRRSFSAWLKRKVAAGGIRKISPEYKGRTFMFSFAQNQRSSCLLMALFGRCFWRASCRVNRVRTVQDQLRKRERCGVSASRIDPDCSGQNRSLLERKWQVLSPSGTLALSIPAADTFMQYSASHRRHISIARQLQASRYTSGNI